MGWMIPSRPLLRLVWVSVEFVLLSLLGGAAEGIRTFSASRGRVTAAESRPRHASIVGLTLPGHAALVGGHAAQRSPALRLRGGVSEEQDLIPVLEGGGHPGTDTWFLPKKNRKKTQKQEEVLVPVLEHGALPVGVRQQSVMSPFEVKGVVDYDRLMTQFGSQPLTPELVERLERITGVEAHYLVRRGFVFSHRDVDLLLNDFEAGKPFFLYTGRGPSSASMHIGHLVPFLLTKWLQLTDDEKFLWKGGELEQYSQMAIENARDIVAVGLDEERTFVFTDTASMDMLYPNVLRIQRHVTCNQVKGIFGVSGHDSIGKMAFPAIQAAPCFSTSLLPMFPDDPDMACLVPCAIDQDPYFRMTRDVASKLGKKKPALLHCKFIPSLQGDTTKMSASEASTAIYLTDTAKEVKKKINKYAFSGGQATVELHRELGGDTNTDVSYRYLEFFEPDDEKLQKVGEDYRAGKILSGEMKALAIECLQGVIERHQKARERVTDDVLQRFMKRRSLQRSTTPPPELNDNRLPI